MCISLEIWVRYTYIRALQESVLILIKSYFGVLRKPLFPSFNSRFCSYKAAHSSLVVLFLGWARGLRQAGTSYMRPHVSGTERVGFSKQDAHGNLGVDTLPVNFPLSAFCQRFPVWTSVGQTQIIPFLLVSRDLSRKWCNSRILSPFSQRVLLQDSLMRSDQGNFWFFLNYEQLILLDLMSNPRHDDV